MLRYPPCVSDRPSGSRRKCREPLPLQIFEGDELRPRQGLDKAPVRLSPLLLAESDVIVLPVFHFGITVLSVSGESYRYTKQSVSRHGTPVCPRHEGVA